MKFFSAFLLSISPAILLSANTAISQPTVPTLSFTPPPGFEKDTIAKKLKALVYEPSDEKKPANNQNKILAHYKGKYGINIYAPSNPLPEQPLPDHDPRIDGELQQGLEKLKLLLKEQAELPEAKTEDPDKPENVFNNPDRQIRQCAESKTVKREEKFDIPPSTPETPVYDILFLEKDFLKRNSITPDPKELFGGRTVIFNYSGSKEDPVTDMVKGANIECLPYRIRLTTKNFFTHSGKDALKIYELDNFEAGKHTIKFEKGGEFHPLIKQLKVK